MVTGVLVQLTGEEAEQHVLGLVEVEPCCDEHPADPAPAPEQRTQTPAAAAVAVPINLMVTEQRVQRSDGPARGGANPAFAPGSRGGCQASAQCVPQQLIAGLMHVPVHAGAPASGRSQDAISAPMRTVASTRPTRDTAMPITGAAPLRSATAEGADCGTTTVSSFRWEWHAGSGPAEHHRKMVISTNSRELYKGELCDAWP